MPTTRYQRVTRDLADALNRLPPDHPMWDVGGFRVNGRWVEIDPEASDRLAARMLGMELRRARWYNNREARWLVAGGRGGRSSDDEQWEPAD